MDVTNTDEERDAVRRWRRSFGQRWPRELVTEFDALPDDRARLQFFIDRPELGKETS